MTAHVKIAHSIAEHDRGAWNACFAHELENYDYLLAVERARISVFDWRYMAVMDGDTILAAVPAFLTDYHLDTTLDDGAPRQMLRTIKKIFPGFLRVKLASIGSPLTEHGKIGFHASVTDAQKPKLIKMLLTAFEQATRTDGYKLIGVKDIPAADLPLWELAQKDLGYSGVAGQPTGCLDITFATEDAYLKTLSRAARKDMKRKLRTRGEIRTEIRTDISDVKDKIYQLYLQTKHRSEFQFEELTPEYFTGVLQHMPHLAFFVLYYSGTELLGANLLLRNDNTLVDKFFCMADAGRAHHLYFISWFENVRYCITHGQKLYVSGQASPDTKRHLGCTMQPNQMLFRHAAPFWNQLLKWAAPMLAMGD